MAALFETGVEEVNADVIFGLERFLASKIDILSKWTIVKNVYNFRTVHAGQEMSTEH